MDFKQFITQIHPQTFSQGEYIFREGDSSNGNLYFLFQGRLNVVKDRPGGRESIVKELEPGQFFGELAIISQRSRSMSIKVESESAKVGILNEAVIERLEKTSPGFLLLLLRSTIEKLTRAEKKLHELQDLADEKEAPALSGKSASAESNASDSAMESKKEILVEQVEIGADPFADSEDENGEN